MTMPSTKKNCLKLAAYERENVNIAYPASIGYGEKIEKGVIRRGG